MIIIKYTSIIRIYSLEMYFNFHSEDKRHSFTDRYEALPLNRGFDTLRYSATGP
jgi:hypothetical protein